MLEFTPRFLSTSKKNTTEVGLKYIIKGEWKEGTKNKKRERAWNILTKTFLREKREEGNIRNSTPGRKKRYGIC